MNKIYFLLLFFIGSYAFGQSNPSAFDLSTGNYSFTDWSATSASGTYPANMKFHFTNDPTGTTYSSTLNGNTDYTCAYNLTSRNRINGQGANGFSFIATGSAQYDNCSSGTAASTRFAGAAVLALISTGKTNIKVSWLGRTIIAGDGATPRSFSIQLQYRLGTTGIWTDVALSTYASAATGNSATTTATLPVTCENRSDLYLRWVYYQTATTGTGSRPELGVDEITVGSVVATNTLALSFSSSTTSALSLPFITGTINDAIDPTSITGFVLDVTENGAAIPAANYTLTVSSSNASVAPIANVSITQNNGNALVKINPAGVGYADLTFTLTKGSFTKTLVTNYAASQSADANAKWLTGFADASSAIALDDNYMVVCNDELNKLYVFNRNTSGLPVATYDFNQNNILELTDGAPAYKEVDVEAGVKSIANVGRMYWMGSQSNSSSFNDKPNRNRIFAVTATGTGSSTTFADAGHYNNLKQYLLTWGDANGYGFTASAAAGVDCKAINGYNIEGMVFGPDNTTMFIGFRAPLVPTANRTKAVIAPILNFEVWFNNGAPVLAPSLGSPIELDLGGRGIREIIRLSTSFYIILAGNYSGTPVNGMVYRWSGNATDAPVALPGFKITDLTAEAALEVFENGTGSLSKLQIIMDNGSKVYYGDAVEAKALTHDGYKKFQSEVFQSLITSGVLAMRFQYIDAVKQGNSTAVSWGFEGASSMSSFVVEKSTNGTTFITLASKVASASSNYTYSFLADKNQRCYYRIKGVSKSGANIYSSIKVIGSDDASGVNIYPNPVNVDGNFNISVNKEAAWQGALFNEAGKLVKRFEIANAHSNVDVKGLSAGSYILKLIGDGEVVTGKLLLR